MNWLRKLIQKIGCDHEYEFVRNLHGDEINQHDGKRSEWQCTKCGWLTYKNYLVLDVDEDHPLGYQLREKQRKYAMQQQDSWEQNNVSFLNSIISEMKEAASKGEESWKGDVVLSKGDFNRFTNFIQGQGLCIKNDTIIDIDIDRNYTKHHLEISWN